MRILLSAGMDHRGICFCGHGSGQLKYWYILRYIDTHLWFGCHFSSPERKYRAIGVTLTLQSVSDRVLALHFKVYI